MSAIVTTGVRLTGVSSLSGITERPYAPTLETALRLTSRGITRRVRNASLSANRDKDVALGRGVWRRRHRGVWVGSGRTRKRWPDSRELANAKPRRTYPGRDTFMAHALLVTRRAHQLLASGATRAVSGAT